jgi:hypothetical protein
VARVGAETAHILEFVAAGICAVLVLIVGGLWRRSKMRAAEAHPA